MKTELAIIQCDSYLKSLIIYFNTINSIPMACSIFEAEISLAPFGRIIRLVQIFEGNQKSSQKPIYEVNPESCVRQFPLLMQ